jgi:hypothetical protein
MCNIQWYSLLRRELDRLGRSNTVKHGRTKHSLAFPQHAFQPEDLLTFVELHGFADDWRKLGLSDDDLQALQVMIMTKPDGAPVIPGTGRLRKVRFAPSHWNSGKRGAARVCYVYFEEFGLVLLVIAYSKNERDDMPAAHKKAYRDLIAREQRELSRRRVK